VIFVVICLYFDFAESCACRHCARTGRRFLDNSLIEESRSFKHIFPCCNVCTGTEEICGIVNSKCGIKKAGTRKKREVREKNRKNRNKKKRNNKRKATDTKKEEYERIFNGDDTEVNEYPWVVAIRQKNPTEPLLVKQPVCGGSLIASQWVLTSGRCVEIIAQNLSAFEIVLGEHDITNADSVDNVQIFGVQKPFLHPDYNVDFLTLTNDVGLLKLTTEVDLTKYTPICLPSADRNYEQQTATAIGWGFTSLPVTPTITSSSFANVLQEAELTVDKTKCTTVLEGELCAKGKSGEDACFFDGGGPLSIPSMGKTNQHFLVGVTSTFASGCVVAGEGSIFADISYFRPWIVDTLKNNGGATFF